MPSRETLKNYYYLTKPGIIRGNLLSVLAGFLLASQGVIDCVLLFYTLIASALVIGGGCVLNNYIDRDIDAKMERTKDRALASNRISGKNAIIYGSLLTFFGLVILYLQTNLIAVYSGILGFIFYVYVYGYFKRSTEHGTLVGAVAGAIPPVVGYLAVSGGLETGAYLVFLILVFWQMPHFYAIAMFRANEYKKADIPVLTITRGMSVTKKYILAYILGYIVVSTLPYFFNLANVGYLVIITTINLYWLNIALKNYLLPPEKWAKKIFGTSLLSLIGFCVAVIAGTML